MCVATPGKVIETDGYRAKVDIFGNVFEVNNMLVTAKIGDYVLIHAGCILEIVSKDTADEIKQLFEELEDIENENA